MALGNAAKRVQTCKAFKQKLLSALIPFSPIIHGVPERTVTHAVSLALPGLDSEAVMLALKDFVAVSNGSACTSSSYQPSHVLKAMTLCDDVIGGTIRISWCHMTEEPDWDGIVKAIKLLF
jgi:cysteine desulfurase